MAAAVQIIFRSSIGNLENISKVDERVEVVGVGAGSLLKDNDEREKEAIAMTECSSLFVCCRRSCYKTVMVLLNVGDESCCLILVGKGSDREIKFK
jgi:hypothetical protein